MYKLLTFYTFWWYLGCSYKGRGNGWGRQNANNKGGGGQGQVTGGCPNPFWNNYILDSKIVDNLVLTNKLLIHTL